MDISDTLYNAKGLQYVSIVRSHPLHALGASPDLRRWLVGGGVEEGVADETGRPRSLSARGGQGAWRGACRRRYEDKVHQVKMAELCLPCSFTHGPQYPVLAAMCTVLSQVQFNPLPTNDVSMRLGLSISLWEFIWGV